MAFASASKVSITFKLLSHTASFLTVQDKAPHHNVQQRAKNAGRSYRTFKHTHTHTRNLNYVTNKLWFYYLLTKIVAHQVKEVPIWA